MVCVASSRLCHHHHRHRYLFCRLHHHRCSNHLIFLDDVFFEVNSYFVNPAGGRWWSYLSGGGAVNQLVFTLALLHIRLPLSSFWVTMWHNSVLSVISQRKKAPGKKNAVRRRQQLVNDSYKKKNKWQHRLSVQRQGAECICHFSHSYHTALAIEREGF